MIKRIKNINVRYKTILSASVLCFTLTQLVGCNTAPNKNINTTQQQSQQYSQQYGEDAYTYLEYLQKNFPKRIAGSETEKLTGDYIINELKSMGYTDENIEIQEFTTDTGIKSRNIILTKKGTKNEQIIVGAHYDSVDTNGIDDNGSGISATLESAKKVAKMETPYTIKFAFWGAEEIGTKGSSYYAESMKKEEKDKTKFVLNIDSILAGDKQYIYGGTLDEKTGKITGTEPLEVVKKLTKELNLDMNLNPGKHSEYPSPTTGNWSDHATFRLMGIPYVYFEATNWDIPPHDSMAQTEKLGKVMHTKNDNLDVINKEFPQRSKERLRDYTKLMHAVLTYQGEY